MSLSGQITRQALAQLCTEAARGAVATSVASPMTGGRGPVIVEAADPAAFIAAFAGAVGSGREVVLADSRWGENERTQLRELLAGPAEVGEAAGAGRESERGWLLIPTGGSGGRLRLARHDEATIAAAVEGFAAHFGVRRVNAAGVLPLHHVSGLMAWMRSLLTGGEYRALDGKQLEGDAIPALSARDDGWFVSLVPTQLERLLARRAAVDWLREMRGVLLGGAPAWPSLLERAAGLRIPLAPGYGMTESSAMVCSLRPAEFLSGARGSGSPLPHARIEIAAGGEIRVHGQSVFRGYWPHRRDERWHDTGDLGRLDEQGRLHVLGRMDDVIITGGEKVSPAEVEAALRATGRFEDVAVVGLPQAEWGMEVVAVFPAGKPPDLAQVRREIGERLSRFKLPKRFVQLDAWPRNEAGKLNRRALVELARKAIGTHA